MLGAFFRKSDRNANSPAGTANGATATLNPRGSIDASARRLNGPGAVSGGATTTGYGFTAVDRSDATT